MTNPTNFGSPITGTLTATTKTVVVSNLQIPASIALNTTDSGKAIAVSIDGTIFNTLTPTASPTGQIYVALNYPVKAIKFTGAINDTYTII